ncbi:MAG: hypothetical protein HZB91_09040 [Elusimicrobia bacterium]|nr:hypothetical protein [Elusimicrobiota bacterium]
MTLPLLAAAAFLAAGCASLKKAFPHKSKSSPAAAAARPAAPARRVDPKAQEAAYEEGMRLFSDEKYAEAKAAWKKSLQMDPDSQIGRKSRENLRKVETILDSLRDIKAQ